MKIISVTFKFMSAVVYATKYLIVHSATANIKLTDTGLRRCSVIHCYKTTKRLIESVVGLRPRQGNLRLVFRLFCLRRGLPSIKFKWSENKPEIPSSRPQPHY